MTNQPDCLLRPVLAKAATLRHYHSLVLVAGLFAGLSACTSHRTDSTKGQRLTLNVGDIREVTIPTRSDTTDQLTATSDNQEVVDVSRKSAVATTGNATNTSMTGSAVFLIKGVTVGTARVVFSEKQVGKTDNGRFKKTYIVTVTSK